MNKKASLSWSVSNKKIAVYFEIIRNSRQFPTVTRTEKLQPIHSKNNHFAIGSKQKLSVRI